MRPTLRLLRASPFARPKPVVSTTVTSTPAHSFLKRNFFVLALGLSAGGLGGTIVAHIVAPAALPVPGTRENDILMHDLTQRVEGEFMVKVLRGKCLGVSKALKGEKGGWVEVVAPPVSAETGLVKGSLQGARGLGVERVFFDRGEGKLVAIVWFGGALSGWPGVTHGGVIATALLDKFALAATLANATTYGGTEAPTPTQNPGTGSHAKMITPTVTVEPERVELNYVKPTLANGFYVIRVTEQLELDQDLNATNIRLGSSASKGGRGYEATLETLDHKICVTARARVDAGSGKVEGSAADGVDATAYADFKRWMWPSRQQGMQAG